MHSELVTRNVTAVVFMGGCLLVTETEETLCIKSDYKLPGKRASSSGPVGNAQLLEAYIRNNKNRL